MSGLIVISEYNRTATVQRKIHAKNVAFKPHLSAKGAPPYQPGAQPQAVGDEHEMSKKLRAELDEAMEREAQGGTSQSNL
jgi:hypothetical protein